MAVIPQLCNIIVGKETRALIRGGPFVKLVRFTNVNFEYAFLTNQTLSNRSLLLKENIAPEGAFVFLLGVNPSQKRGKYQIGVLLPLKVYLFTVTSLYGCSAASIQSSNGE